VAEANRANSGLTRHAAEGLVDQAIRERRVMHWMRDWAVNLCAVNKPAFDDFLEGAGKPVTAFLNSLGEPAAPGRNWNAPDGGAGHQPDQGEAVFRRLGLTSEDVKTYGGAPR
jgi:hypothetical protein